MPGQSLNDKKEGRKCKEMKKSNTTLLKISEENKNKKNPGKSNKLVNWGPTQRQRIVRRETKEP